MSGDTATKHAVAAALVEAGRKAEERAEDLAAKLDDKGAERDAQLQRVLGTSINLALTDAAVELTKPAPKMTERIL